MKAHALYQLPNGEQVRSPEGVTHEEMLRYIGRKFGHLYGLGGDAEPAAGPAPAASDGERSLTELGLASLAPLPAFNPNEIMAPTAPLGGGTVAAINTPPARPEPSLRPVEPSKLEKVADAFDYTLGATQTAVGNMGQYLLQNHLPAVLEAASRAQGALPDALGSVLAATAEPYAKSVDEELPPTRGGGQLLDIVRGIVQGQAEAGEKRMAENVRRKAIEDPFRLDDIVTDPGHAALSFIEGSGPTTALMVPSLAAAYLSGGALAPLPALAAASLLPRVAESAMEAGAQQEDARKRGRTEAEAKAEADKVFLGNLPLASMDAAELALVLAPLPPWARKLVSGLPKNVLGKLTVGGLRGFLAALGEGAEEGIQGEISDAAAGEGFDLDPRKWDPNAVHQGVLSGLLFGAPGVATEVAQDVHADKVSKDLLEAVKAARVTSPDAQQLRTLIRGNRVEPTFDDRTKARWAAAPDWLPEASEDRARWAAGELSDEDVATDPRYKGAGETAMADLQAAAEQAERDLGLIQPEPVAPADVDERVTRGVDTIRSSILAHADTVATTAPEQAEALRRQAASLQLTEPHDDFHRALRDFGRRRGVAVAFYQGDRDLVVTGYHAEPGLVLLRADSGQTGLVLGTLFHEMQHDLRAKDPEAVRALQQLVAETMPEQWQASRQYVAGLYQSRIGQTLDQAKLDDETLSHVMERSAPGILRAIAKRGEVELAAKTPGPVGRVMEWTNGWLKRFSRFLGRRVRPNSDVSRRLVTWGSDLSAATDNRARSRVLLALADALEAQVVPETTTEPVAPAAAAPSSPPTTTAPQPAGAAPEAPSSPQAAPAAPPLPQAASPAAPQAAARGAQPAPVTAPTVATPPAAEPALPPPGQVEAAGGVSPPVAAAASEAPATQRANERGAFAVRTHDDYRMEHRPPDAEGGAPLHELTDNGIYPADVYTHPRYYTTSPDEDTAARIAARLRGNPDAMVRVFRAVPPGVNAINPGDWVTPVRAYARRHGMDATDSAKDWPVISMRVKASELFTDGNSLAEWGYHPQSRSAEPVAAKLDSGPPVQSAPDDQRFAISSPYGFDLERHPRHVIDPKKVKITGEEQAIIAAEAARLGVAPGVLEQVHRETVARHPTSGRAGGRQHWAPLELLAFEVKEGKNGTPLYGGVYRVQAYRFNKGEDDRALTGDERARRVRQLARKMADEIEANVFGEDHRGDPNVQVIRRAESWYRTMFGHLTDAYGASARLFSDLLGALSPITNVRENYRSAVEAFERFAKGDFDQELAAYEAHLEAGGSAGPKGASNPNGYDGPLITKYSGALFGTNSRNAMQAMLGLWRELRPGSAPKARNFGGNLTGESLAATVDVWAARFLDYLAGKDRIPPMAEAGIGGKVESDRLVELGRRIRDLEAKDQTPARSRRLAELRKEHAAEEKHQQRREQRRLPRLATTGAFGFGQDVFAEAARILNKRGYQIAAPDLHAIAWFYEKARWTVNNWTSREGEGGSFEEQRHKYPTRRHQVGISASTSTHQPSLEEVRRIRERFDEVLKNDPLVRGYRNSSTIGGFMDYEEPSFDLEIHAHPSWDPSRLRAVVEAIAAEHDQEAYFLARQIRPTDNTAGGHPALEVYFTDPVDRETARSLTADLLASGAGGFTFSADPLQYRDDPDLFAGVRVLMIPAIGDLAGWVNMTDAERAQTLRNGKVRLLELKRDLVSRGGVRLAKLGSFDVELFWKGGRTDAYATRGVEGGSGSVGGGDATRRGSDSPVQGGDQGDGGGGPVAGGPGGHVPSASPEVDTRPTQATSEAADQAASSASGEPFGNPGQFAVAPGPGAALQAGWALEAEGWWDARRREVQDRFLRVRRLQESIEKHTGAALPDELDVYRMEEQYYGRVGYETEKAQKELVDPLVKRMNRLKVDPETLDLFLYARHARERNAYLWDLHVTKEADALARDIAKLGRAPKRLREAKEAELAALKEREKADKETLRKIADTFRDTSLSPAERDAKMLELKGELNIPHSGMTDLEALAVIEDFRKQGLVDVDVAAEELRQNYFAKSRIMHPLPKVETYSGTLGELAEMFDKITHRRLSILFEESLITEDEMNAVAVRYRFYAPLKGRALPGDLADAFDESNRAGSGFDIRGPDLERAFGRKLPATHPILVQAVLDLEEAIIRAEKNKVGEAFLKLAEQFPDVMVPGPTGEDRLFEINPEHQKYIYNPRTKRAQLVDDRFANEQAGWVFAVKREGKTVYLEVRDANLVKAMKNLGSESLAGQTLVVNSILRVLRGSTRYLAAVNTTLNPEFVLSNFLRDYQTAGINLTEEEGLKLAKAVLNPRNVGGAAAGIWSGQGESKGEASEWASWWERYQKAGAKVSFFGLKDVEAQAREIATGWKRAGDDWQAMAWRTAHFAGQIVERANTSVENAMRLIAFRTAIESGQSELQAASLARNLTVNFNRRGEVGPAASALYMFANASLQGSHRLFSAARRSSRVRATLGMIAAGAFGLQVWNRYGGGEDEDGVAYVDKLPEWVRNRHLVLMLRGPFEGKALLLPLPYGYNIAHMVGTAAADMAFGDRPVVAGALDVVGAAVSAFNPLGDLKLNTWHGFVTSMAPTIVDVGVDLSSNRKYTGGPIWPEAYPGETRPGSERFWKSTPPAFVKLSRLVNEWSGGNAWEPGSVFGFETSPPPNLLEYAFDTIAGGAGRTLGRLVGTATDLFRGELPEPGDIPFIRRVVGEADDRSVPGVYRTNADDIRSAADAYEGLVETNPEAVNDWLERRGHLLPLVDYLKDTEKAIREARKAGDEDQVTRLQKQLNRAYRLAEENRD